MIVEAILTALFAVVGVLISLFNLPDMPQQFIDVYNQFLPYINNALDFVFFLFNKSLLLAGVSFLIGLFVILRTIDLFTWVWGVVHGKVGKDE